MTNSSSQKSLIFVWYPDFLDSLSSLSSERDDEEEEGIIEIHEMSNIWISIPIEYLGFIDIDDEFEVDDKYSELSNRSDYDIIISIIDNYVLSKIIEYAWVCVSLEVP